MLARRGILCSKPRASDVLRQWRHALALAERPRGLADTLAGLIADPRDRSHITHTVADLLRARMLAIGYPDGNDLNWLHNDPAFELACGRLLDTSKDLCSQPMVSRVENAPTLKEIIRLS